MDVDYQLRARHGTTLFKIRPAELHRRLRYLDQRAEDRGGGGGVSSRERPDPRPGVDGPETIYVLNGTGGDAGELIAVERHDEARLQGRASLMSAPAALSAPRSAEALLAFAEMAKNGGNYDAANAAFALALREHFPRVDCSLAVRETPKTPTGEMTDGYYDLAYVRSGAEETCIPVPMLRGDVAYWFAAHAERRAPQEHNREPTGAGPTVEDLEGLRGREAVGDAVRETLAPGALDGRYDPS
jgi:hypothetical protein